jgi:hypothetical protein
MIFSSGPAELAAGEDAGLPHRESEILATWRVGVLADRAAEKLREQRRHLKIPVVLTLGCRCAVV